MEPDDVFESDEHPVTAKPMRFQSKLPADMALLRACLAKGS